VQAIEARGSPRKKTKKPPKYNEKLIVPGGHVGNFYVLGERRKRTRCSHSLTGKRVPEAAGQGLLEKKKADLRLFDKTCVEN